MSETTNQTQGSAETARAVISKAIRQTRWWPGEGTVAPGEYADVLLEALESAGFRLARAADPARPHPVGVGMPQWLLLNEFADIVRDDFQTGVYLVGSALQGKAPRDIDVRVILPDDDCLTRFPSGPHGESPVNCHGTRWASQCLAYSALGKQMTGLPIDFQVQLQSLVDTQEAIRPRIALGGYRSSAPTAGTGGAG